MALPQADQLLVWATPAGDLTTTAKVVWEYMADTDDPFSTATAAEDISAGIGGSYTPAEVDTALTELNEKGYLQLTGFRPQVPST